MPITKVILEHLLYPEFQPIVAVKEGRVVGYEALIRGPEELHLRDPASLFRRAAECGMLRALERACFSAIVEEVSENLDKIPQWTRVFVNVLPEDMLDPAFLAHVVEELHRTRLDPARLVMEITETSRIEDYQTFNAALGHFRELGIGVAVDDAGAGHAGLQMIAEINPDFLKVDQSLVRGIDASIAKRAGVEALLLLSRSLGMTVIAEGIETEDELQELNRLGVALGQGFLLARPTRGMPTGIGAVPHQSSGAQWGSLKSELPGARGRIGDIATPAPTVAPSTELRKVRLLFDERRSCDSIVVVERGTPVGLVMRNRFREELSRPFADGRMAKAAIERIAGNTPLVVDFEESLDAVAQQIAGRKWDERYDDIVVVRDGKLAGVVSLAALLDAMSANRIASASHANALTGLPGHPAIEEWLREFIRKREQVVMVHVDIDALREFNSAYGFHQGDRAIKIAAELLEGEINAASSGGGRLGHVGGDDFLALIDERTAEHLAKVLPAMFRDRVLALYHPEDRARGFLQRSGANGMQRTPLMSLTVASVRVPGARNVHYAQLLDALADARSAARTRSRAARETELAALISGKQERKLNFATGGVSAA